MAQILTSLDPATGETLGQVAVSSHEDIHACVSRAHDALEQWQTMTPSERGCRLKQAGPVLLEQAEQLGELLCREMGKPRKSGIGEVKSCGHSLAQKIDDIVAALQPHRETDKGIETTTSYNAMGVAAIISPWNYPLAMPQWMLLPALVAGNCVILKPSEETPLIAQAYVDILNKFLPPGVLQLVQGDDEQGKVLVEADVNLIAFTGSRRVGIDIMRRSADNLKRLVLELGGKDPLIVLAGAELEAAAQFAVFNSIENSGQMCVSTERIFVHSDIAEAFEQRVCELASTVAVGPWHYEGVQMGPMIHAQQKQQVLDQVEAALQDGARALIKPPVSDDLYLAPIVLSNITPQMSIAREETFGPVVCISRFDDINEALRQANDTPYGLGGVVFGEPLAAEQVANRLQAGMIGINKSIFGVGDTPWVGAKQSGYGYHGSADGSRQFAQVRVTSKPAL